MQIHLILLKLSLVPILLITFKLLRHGLLSPKNFHKNASQDTQENFFCLTSVDCAMNGECEKPSSNDPQVPGVCRCFGGFKGPTCETLDLLPVLDSKQGLQLPNHTSSWGGSVIFYDGKYHMFASEIVNNCGLDYWTTNSQVIRATSTKSAYGPYVKEQVILPTFAHDANVVVAPSGEIVLFVTARIGVKPADCTHSTGTGSQIENFNKNTTAPPKHSYMLWAPHPHGPWSEPILVINSTKWNEDYWAKKHRFAHCDANLNGIILDDGSFLGLWRRCETTELKTIPHTLYAKDWRNASSYQPNPTPLFVLGGSGAEDPTNIWTTQTKDVGRAYHAIFHDEQATRCMLGQCSANGRHAFSLDGKAWTYSKVNAYDRNVNFANGDLLVADTRARPHMIVGENNQLLALSTGIKPRSDSGYVWTLVQPLRQA